MAQYIFGAGILWGVPLQDATGAAITNPTPIQFGTLQDVSLDVSFDTKKLYGNLQFPVAVGRGKGSLTGKAHFAQINGAILNSLFFGQTVTAGIIGDVLDTTGAAIPTTPFAITPTVPSSGTWSVDLGVKNASGLPMTRVDAAATPTTGQYKVAAGVYTFATADTGLTVFISYQYTATSTSAKKSTVQNLPMGYAPSFRVDLLNPYAGKMLTVTLPNAIGSKLSFASKLDDFMIPEFDFEGFADASGNVMTWATTE